MLAAEVFVIGVVDVDIDLDVSFSILAVVVDVSMVVLIVGIVSWSRIVDDIEVVEMTLKYMVY